MNSFVKRVAGEGLISRDERITGKTVGGARRLSQSKMINQLKSDLMTAMNAGDKFRRDMIRSIQSDLKNAGIDKKGRDGLTDEVASPVEYLTDGEMTAVLQKAVKSRRESAEQYVQGGRAELAEKETSEADFIAEYLPKAMPANELEAVVREAIAEVGAASMADMGKVMKVVQPKVAGRADGKAISTVVRGLLA